MTLKPRHPIPNPNDYPNQIKEYVYKILEYLEDYFGEKNDFPTDNTTIKGFEGLFTFLAGTGRERTMRQLHKKFDNGKKSVKLTLLGEDKKGHIQERDKIFVRNEYGVIIDSIDKNPLVTLSMAVHINDICGFELDKDFYKNQSPMLKKMFKEFHKKGLNLNEALSQLNDFDLNQSYSKSDTTQPPN